MPEKDADIAVTHETPAAAPARSEGLPPMLSLKSEIDRLFEEFASGFWRSPMTRRLPDLIPAARGWGVSPATELVDCDGEYRITAELPGMDAGSIEVKLTDGMVSIRGEKAEERKEEKDDYLLSERRYGSFARSLPLPSGIDGDKVAARFANGVLTITLPKSAEAKSRERRIEIKAA